MRIAARLWVAIALALPAAALPAIAGAMAETPRDDWRHVVTSHDRVRLRDWRTAWMAAMADARSGAGAATIAADPALFDPDSALVDGALPPPGEYRCRHLALGARVGVPALTVDPWGRCRIEPGEPPLQLTGFDGVQRPTGLIYTDTDRRAIFLGTTMFPDEHRPATYGHAAGRDMAGAVERIGERRWRLVLPYPRFGAALDLIELRPAGA